MTYSISYNRDDESDEAKARWFQSLSLQERMELFSALTDMILENNPRILERKRHAKPITLDYIIFSIEDLTGQENSDGSLT